MNKKEIAQQFTRQILDQDPSTLTQQQVLLIIQEIQHLCAKVEQSSNQYSTSLRILSHTILDLQTRAQTLNNQLDQLNGKMSTTVVYFQKSQKVLIWHRYWTAIAVGIITSLITNLIWVIRT